MPVIPTFGDQLTPQGTVNVRSRPDDFGAQVGAGMQNFGAGLGQVADVIQRIEDDKANMWAYDASSRYYLDSQQNLTDRVNALDPTAPDYAEKYGVLSDEYERHLAQQEQTIMEAAPSRSAQKILQSHLARNRNSLVMQARQAQAKVAASHMAQTTENGIKLDQDSISADPSNENYYRLDDARKTNLGQLKSVSPEVREKWYSDFKHGIALTQSEVLFSTDPVASLKKVNARGGKVTFFGNLHGAVPGKVNVIQALAKQESGGKQFNADGSVVTSPVGAVGKFQIMPGTGPEAAALAGVEWDPEKLKSDEAYNEKLGTAYFNKQLQDFGGDIPKALAAYNAGPSKVRALSEKYGADWLANAPQETQGYVANITKALGAQGPTKGSGEEFPQVEPLTDQEIAASKPDIAGWNELTWQEKVAMVRKAEGVLGSKVSGERGRVDTLLKDMQAKLLDGKKWDGAVPTEQELTKLFGPDGGPQRARYIKSWQQVGGFIGQMNVMPVAQANMFLNNLEPTGDLDYAERSQVFEQAKGAYAKMIAGRNKDFMGWAKGQGFAQPLKMDTPEDLAAGLRSRMPVMVTGEREYQVPNAAPFDAGEAEALNTFLDRLVPDDQLRYFKSVREGLQGDDRFFLSAMSQIAPKNSTRAYAAVLASRSGTVATSSGNQTADVVAKYVLDGDRLLRSQGVGDDKAVSRQAPVSDKDLQPMFQSATQGGFASFDAAESYETESASYHAVKAYLAADAYYQHKDLRNLSQNDMDNAVKAVLGDTLDQSDNTKLFLPWGVNKDQFRKAFAPALDTALAEAGITKGSAVYAPWAYTFRNKGEGVYQVVLGGKALVGKQGNVIVDISDLSAVPAGPDRPVMR